MAPATSSQRQPLQPSPATLDQPQTTPLPIDGRIRIRAHEIWLAHDGQGGSAEADWLQAEEEILNQTDLNQTEV
jgi:hypothetical protein